jgi:hypothetical protein
MAVSPVLSLLTMEVILEFVHDYFTRLGRLVVVLGYDEDGYNAYDPAGAWSQVFKGGYSSGGSGRATFYRRSAFEADIATSDGYTRLSLWYHLPS